MSDPTNPAPDAVTRQYAQRDTESLGDLYLRHVEAMTAEGLHEKSAIAAELAWRDKLIADQQKRLCDLRDAAFRVLTSREKVAQGFYVSAERMNDLSAALSSTPRESERVISERWALINDTTGTVAGEYDTREEADEAYDAVMSAFPDGVTGMYVAKTRRTVEVLAPTKEENHVE